MKKELFFMFFIAATMIFSTKLYAEQPKNNGYFWEKLNPSAKLAYVIWYVEGIGELNLEIRHQMNVITLLYDEEKTEENKYLSKYGKEMGSYFEEHYQYFNIPYRQLVEGIDALYKEYINKTITLVDAIDLVKAEIKGVEKNQIEKRKKFMRLNEEEQGRIMQKDEEKKN
jgi:hypothetical protein